MNTQRVEGHTPRTMGELVKAHASRNTLSTHHGFEMLELSGATEHTCAANTYLAALSIIRKQEKVNEALMESLAEAIKWIENAPEDAWGYANDDHARWPLRDELVSKLCKALAKEPA